MDIGQVQLERALTKAIEMADGAVACHLMSLDDESLSLLKDPRAAGQASVTVWMALSERLGYPPRSLPSEVLRTFIESLQSERGLEAQRRSGGSGFYEPRCAAVMVGYLRGGREGLALAQKQFPILGDYEQDRFSSQSVD